MKYFLPIFALSLLILAAGVQAQIVNRPPMPSWIKVEDAGAGTVEKHFDYSGKLLKGILLLAVESRTTLSVNGKVVGEFDHADLATSIDITSYLRDGDNTIILTSKGAVAAQLELNGDLSRRKWVISDDTWKPSQGKLVVRGAVDADPAKNPFDPKKAFNAYESWQLAKAGNQDQATDASTLTLPTGFHAELLRSAKGEEGSWIALAFDPQGRLTIARERKGLLRLTMKQQKVDLVEVINDTLLECRGLLYANGVLYADANNSKGLYRLRDTHSDGQFDEVTEILHSNGGVGHGRNHLKLGPDGKIYVIFGNNVQLPTVAVSSMVKNYASDQLMPNPWDSRMFDGDVELPAGHLLRMNSDGTHVEMIAAGLRNPMDVAFNRQGDIFTFDADMERDVGAKWYMPTRILQLVPGADYGWRRGTGRWPAWYPDTLPSVLDIGLSSPTGIFFGYGAKFPASYRDALFTLDWAYGRILAIHLSPRGASYGGTQETFVAGRPLNVTDGCIGPDGAMWFVTGGRGTQSGLYRVTYTGQASPPEPDKQNDAMTPLQAQRRKLESLQSNDALSDADVGEILQSLGSEDRFISHAARIALENVPADRWRLSSLSGGAWLQAALSLVHQSRKESRGEILSALREKLSHDEKQSLADELRLLELVFIRLGSPNLDERHEWLEILEGRYPNPANDNANRELCKLLVYLESPKVVEKTIQLLATAKESEDLVYYPMIIRYIKTGWTVEQRRAVFEAMNQAETLNGASAYFKAISDTRSEMAAMLTPDEIQRLAGVIQSKLSVQFVPGVSPGKIVKEWKLEDLTPVLDQVSKGRSYEKARAALISCGCVACHRVSNDATLPFGVVGPDLSAVSSRFNRRDLLDNIINPSKVIDEKYRNVIITRIDGTRAVGAIDSEDEIRLVLKPNPLTAEKIEIPKNMIKSRKLSDVSPMPTSLLDSLTAEQILDVLAYFEAGGDAKYKAFRAER